MSNFYVCIFVSSGDTDGRVPVLSTRYSLSSLGLPIKRAWRPWYHQKQVQTIIVHLFTLELGICISHLTVMILQPLKKVFRFSFRLLAGFKSTMGSPLQRSEELVMLCLYLNQVLPLHSFRHSSRGSLYLRSDKLLMDFYCFFFEKLY